MIGVKLTIVLLIITFLSTFIVKAIVAGLDFSLDQGPKCFNCRHYHPGFMENCGCDCNHFSKYEDKNKVVTFNEF